LPVKIHYCNGADQRHGAKYPTRTLLTHGVRVEISFPVSCRFGGRGRTAADALPFLAHEDQIGVWGLCSSFTESPCLWSPNTLRLLPCEIFELLRATARIHHHQKNPESRINMFPAFVLLLSLVIVFLIHQSHRPVAAFLHKKAWIKPGAPKRLEKNLSPQQRQGTLPKLPKPRDATALEEMQLHKSLYHKLHNLEKHTSVLPQARDLLITLFAEALAEAKVRGDDGILAIERFDPEALARLLRNADDHVAARFENYIARREDGAPREMFRDQEAARTWLIQRAPVTYVDGAWLGHIHRVTTPFALRAVTKSAWQVMSEELGDGNLAKNHAHIYRCLMDDLGAGLPDADSAEFIQPSCGLNEPEVWKAAVSQLLISLFPQEFLPEILAFNMQFECLTWDTMRAVKELKELSLDNYYFLLHISIDNADTGHTAMAAQVVIDYLQHVLAEHGEAATQQAWKRVQVGYLLSEKFSVQREPQSNTANIRNRYATELIKIIKAKAQVAQKLHCASKMNIGSRRLVDWLDADVFASEQQQKTFLEALSKTRPWIRAGDSAGSKFIQELSRNGKMFGAFTEAEVEVMKNWINALATRSGEPVLYWNYVGRKELSSEESLRNQDVRVIYPIFSTAREARTLGDEVRLLQPAVSDV
jgi:Iron-containing redox enzyme